MNNVLGDILESNLKFERMKKLVFLFGIMLSMIACSGNSVKNAETSDSTSVDTTLVDSALVDTTAVDSI